MMHDVSREFQKINAEALRKDLPGDRRAFRRRQPPPPVRRSPGDAAKPAAERRPTWINTPSTSPAMRERARSIRCWPATPRSAR